MRTPRQHFPYTKGTGIFVHAPTLNLLAQVKATGESWTMCVERIVRQWAKDRRLVLHEEPTIQESLEVRYKMTQDEFKKMEEGGNDKSG